MENAIKTKLVIVLAKLISISLIIVSFWITVSPLGWGSTGAVYIAIMLVENTAFVASLSPMAIFLIPLAAKLINSGGLLYLVLGYGAAVAGNLISYVFGRMMPVHTTDPRSPFSILAVASTYWHPQLASLTAFGAGAREVRLPQFLALSLPISALYYFFVVAAIFAAGGAITSVVSSDVFLVAILAAWLVWDLLQLFNIVKARC